MSFPSRRTRPRLLRGTAHSTQSLDLTCDKASKALTAPTDFRSLTGSSDAMRSRYLRDHELNLLPVCGDQVANRSVITFNAPGSMLEQRPAVSAAAAFVDEVVSVEPTYANVSFGCRGYSHQLVALGSLEDLFTVIHLLARVEETAAHREF